MNNDIQNIAEAYRPEMSRAAFSDTRGSIVDKQSKWHVSILHGSEDGPVMITITAKSVKQFSEQEVLADGVFIDFDTNIGEVWKD